MPASYMDSSESGDEEEHGEEERLGMSLGMRRSVWGGAAFAHYAQACNQMEFVGPLTRTMVQTAKPEPARL
jgi:hypothetical protein